LNNRFKDMSDELDKLFNERGLPPELKVVGDNMAFEKKVEEHPIPAGIGAVKVFGY